VILPDVNVLVYAFRREAEHHEKYASWLTGVVGGTEELGLADPVLTGFLRVVTNPRIFADPAPTPAALALVDRLRSAGNARSLGSTTAAWQRFRQFTDDPHVRGNLVPDAWLAALATTTGARLATADAGVARFPGLHWFDPARPAPDQ